MTRYLAVAAALALGMGVAQAQDKSATDKVRAFGEQNTKEVNEARAKKRAEEDARSAANKAERDKNPPGSQMKKKLEDNAKAREEMQKKNAGAKKPKY
jgi:uncharacterized protein HemX